MKPDNTEEKLVKMESLMAHLQYELEQLNSVIIEQNAKIDRMSSAQEKFEHQLQSMAQQNH